jgi:hypothetical protein
VQSGYTNQNAVTDLSFENVLWLLSIKQYSPKLSLKLDTEPDVNAAAATPRFLPQTLNFLVLLRRERDHETTIKEIGFASRE